MKLHLIKSIVIAALLVLVTQQAWSHDIKRIGSFSNFKFTAEHQYGTSIELWQEGENIFGILSSAEGLAGDTPAGLLENISFDKKQEKYLLSRSYPQAFMDAVFTMIYPAETFLLLMVLLERQQSQVY